MLVAISTMIPVFAIVLVGFICGRCGLLGAKASTEFNVYVVRLALPAFLFQAVSKFPIWEMWTPGFILAFSAGSASVFVVALSIRLFRGGHLSDATIDGLNAGYSNVGYVGFPLCQAMFGPQELALATVAALLTVCVLFGIALALIEADLNKAARPSRAIAMAARSLATNPLLIAPLAGAAVSISGIALPKPMEDFTHFLSGSVTPCALMSLGLFLATTRYDRVWPTWSSLLHTALKLVVQPLVTAFVALWLLRLPTDMAKVAILMAALPTGTGPFMLAEYYNRPAIGISHVILLSTGISAVTLAACVYFLG